MHSSNSLLNFLQLLCVCVGIVATDVVLGSQILSIGLPNK